MLVNTLLAALFEAFLQALFPAFGKALLAAFAEPLLGPFGSARSTTDILISSSVRTGGTAAPAGAIRSAICRIQSTNARSNSAARDPRSYHRRDRRQETRAETAQWLGAYYPSGPGLQGFVDRDIDKEVLT